MLKYLTFLVLIASPFVICYDEKYDQMDVDGILADNAKFSAYLDCLLDKGPCTETYADEFRKLLPEMIQTACKKCTPKQKLSVRKTVKAIKEKKPELLAEFSKKFDPTSEHQEKFFSFISATELRTRF